MNNPSIFINTLFSFHVKRQSQNNGDDDDPDNDLDNVDDDGEPDVTCARVSPCEERERAGKIEEHVQSQTQLGVGVMSSLRKMMSLFFCKNKDG